MSRPFDALSMELILRIVKSVESIEDLKVLARTSALFHRITIPLLYEHVYLETDRDVYAEYDREELEEESVDDFFERTQPLVRRLRNLTELLLRKPNYARLVRSLTMRTLFHTASWKGWRGLLDIALTEEIKTAIRVASHSRAEERKWLRDAGVVAIEDGLVALLIPALVNLEKLDLMLGWDMKHFQTMLQRAALRQTPLGQPPRLQNLTDSMSTWFIDEGGMDPEITAPYFALPAMQRIFLHRIRSEEHDHTLDRGLAALEAGSSTVAYLELRDSRMNAADLSRMLSLPRALDTFIYEVGFGDLTRCRFSTTFLRNALEHQVGSLKDIWLDYTENCIVWYEDFDEVTPMASFKNFGSLKRLRIAAVYLFGDRQNGGKEIRTNLTEVFPPVLEELHFTHCEACFDLLPKALEPLIIYKDQYVPSLQRIILEGPFTNMKELRQGIARLLPVADTFGIEMTTLENYLEDPGKFELSERPWGMDGEFEWAECVDNLNRRPSIDVVEIPHLNIEGSCEKRRRSSASSS